MCTTRVMRADDHPAPPAIRAHAADEFVGPQRVRPQHVPVGRRWPHECRLRHVAAGHQKLLAVDAGLLRAGSHPDDEPAPRPMARHSASGPTFCCTPPSLKSQAQTLLKIGVIGYAAQSEPMGQHGRTGRERVAELMARAPRWAPPDRRHARGHILGATRCPHKPDTMPGADSALDHQAQQAAEGATLRAEAERAPIGTPVTAQAPGTQPAAAAHTSLLPSTARRHGRPFCEW